MINPDALDALLARYQEVLTAMSQPEVASDPGQLATLGRELSGLEPAVTAARQWRELRDEAAGPARDGRRRVRRDGGAGRGRAGGGRGPAGGGREGVGGGARAEGPRGRPRRHRRDPGRDRRRRGGPVRGRPVRPLPEVRRVARLENRGHGHLRGDGRRVPRHHVRPEGPGRVRADEVRVRRPPRPARAGDREPGPRPHVGGDGGGAPGGRGGRRRDPGPGRPRRRLPLVGARRPVL